MRKVKLLYVMVTECYKKSKLYLNHYADNTLNAHDENAFGTLFGRVSVAVTDRVLSLDAEQKRRSKPVNVANTRFPSGYCLIS